MVISQVLSRLEAIKDLRPGEPFPEFKHIEKLNYARRIWGVPSFKVKSLTPEEAFERGRVFVAKALKLEIEKIKIDIARGL